MFKHLILDVGGVFSFVDEAAPLQLFLSKDSARFKKAKKILSIYELLTDKGKLPYSAYVKKFNTLIGKHFNVQEYQKFKYHLGKFNRALVGYCKRHRRKFHTSILSDNNRSNVMYYNKFLKLKDFTYHRTYSYFYKITKPQRKIFLIHLNKLRAKPNECVFVDDGLGNVRAARKLGMKGILFKSNRQLFSELDSCFR